MVWLVLLGSAFASGPWSGIPAGDVAGLGPAVFRAPEAGWVAPVEAGEGGDVRVYVGRSETDAHEWLAGQRSQQSWTVPDWPMADEAWGNGHSLLAFRDGNVCVVVTMEAGGAAAVAESLHARLEPDSPWPVPPEVTVADTMVQVAGEWAYVAFRPGPLLDPATLLPKEIRAIPVTTTAARLDARPKHLEVTVYDRYGRSATSAWP